MKLRPGLMRCRSEVSFLVLAFCLFGEDVKFTHGLIRCRNEFHFLCLLFCLFGVDVKLGDKLMRCRLDCAFQLHGWSGILVRNEADVVALIFGKA